MSMWRCIYPTITFEPLIDFQETWHGSHTFGGKSKIIFLNSWPLGPTRKLFLAQGNNKFGPHWSNPWVALMEKLHTLPYLDRHRSILLHHLPYDTVDSGLTQDSKHWCSQSWAHNGLQSHEMSQCSHELWRWRCFHLILHTTVHIFCENQIQLSTGDQCVTHQMYFYVRVLYMSAFNVQLLPLNIMHTPLNEEKKRSFKHHLYKICWKVSKYISSKERSMYWTFLGTFHWNFLHTNFTNFVENLLKSLFIEKIQH